ncbi:hypothetical protein CDL12_24156 [Handroanthus impetiginosus]|uniref:Uncharacterized protein n=1 Tax=Handroanthus impetiginosus TaxID=429701 RepID=A0A2G9GDE5_9LAMI|nr:hypothetical protein CDL12_24156 [Handroanthus impetiginosus]
MEKFRSSPTEINGIGYLNKKRKLRNELLEMPLPKHICWGQNTDYDSSSNSSTEPKKLESENESDQGSAKDSNSFHSNKDSIMHIDNESNTYSGYREICPSDQPSTSSVSWGSSSSGTLPSTNSESISDHSDRPDYKFGSDYNGSFLEYRNDGIEQLTDKELENLLYSNGVASSQYVLSSGRWPVDQDAQQESKKLTIDKEFEQYFSMLML